MNEFNADPIANANAVRAKNGQPPIDSNRIQGFDTDEPMPSFDNPFPPPAEELLEQQTVTFTDAHFTGQSDVVVRDDVEVWYQGSKVAYSEALHPQVKRLILQALKNEIVSELKRLGTPRAKVAVKRPAVAGAPAAPKRGKGRPKGSLNKKTLEKLAAQPEYVDITA